MDNLLGAQTDREDPSSPDVSVPSAALVAQAVAAMPVMVVTAPGTAE